MTPLGPVEGTVKIKGDELCPNLQFGQLGNISFLVVSTGLIG